MARRLEKSLSARQPPVYGLRMAGRRQPLLPAGVPIEIRSPFNEAHPGDLGITRPHGEHVDVVAIVGEEPVERGEVRAALAQLAQRGFDDASTECASHLLRGRGVSCDLNAFGQMLLAAIKDCYH